MIKEWKKLSQLNNDQQNAINYLFFLYVQMNIISVKNQNCIKLQYMIFINHDLCSNLHLKIVVVFSSVLFMAGHLSRNWPHRKPKKPPLIYVPCCHRG